MDNTVIIKKSRLNKVMKLGGVEVKLIRNNGIYFLANNESMLNGNSAENKHGYLYTWREEDDSRTDKYVYFRGITVSIMAETKIIKKRKAYCEARGIFPTVREIKEYRRELRELKPDIMASRKMVQCCYSGVYLYDVNGIETFDGIAHVSERENLVRCIELGELIHKDNAIRLGRGNYIHESYEHLLRECDDCGTFHLDREMYEVNGRDVCGRCYHNYRECSSCGYEFHRDDLNHYHFGDLCSGCSEDVTTCDECGDEFLDIDNEHLCPDCKGKAIKDYSTKFEDLPDYGNKLMFGVEMEFEVKQGDNRESVARDFKEELGDTVMIKEDGSIDYGFEVVTRPLSMEDAVKTCATICECSQYDCYEHPTTGVHIHISKAALSEIQICKMISIFGEIEEDIEKIAGREASSWAKISKKKFSEIRKEGYDEFMKKEKEERYRAINLRNKHTVEFRVFAGTMDENIMEAYILFVAAIVIASKRISGADIDNGLTSEKIFSYVSKNKRYDNLRTYLSSVGVKF